MVRHVIKRRYFAGQYNYTNDPTTVQDILTRIKLNLIPKSYTEALNSTDSTSIAASPLVGNVSESIAVKDNLSITKPAYYTAGVHESISLSDQPIRVTPITVLEVTHAVDVVGITDYRFIFETGNVVDVVRVTAVFGGSVGEQGNLNSH